MISIGCEFIKKREIERVEVVGVMRIVDVGNWELKRPKLWSASRKKEGEVQQERGWRGVKCPPLDEFSSITALRDVCVYIYQVNRM